MNEERDYFMDCVDENVCRNLIEYYVWGSSKKEVEESLLKFLVVKNIGYVFVDFSNEDEIKESLERINELIEKDWYSDDDCDDIVCVMESMECIFLFVDKWGSFDDEYLKMFFRYMEKYNFNRDYVEKVLEDIEI